MEEWRPIPRFPNYEISSAGNVKNIVRNKPVLPVVNDAGYTKLKLTNDEKVCKTVFVHRLVASAYILDYSPELTVDHINRNRSDNRVCNLRMATAKEQHTNKVIGSSGMRLPIQQYTPCGTYVATFASAQDAARTLGFRDPSHLYKVAGNKHKYKTAYGFIWRYVDKHDSEDVWKECAPHIFVSAKGKIRRKSRSGTFRVIEPTDIYPNAAYPVVNVYGKLRLVHRLVAEHFLPPPDNPSKTIVNHIDGNKRNPDVSNLEWVNYSENSLHWHSMR